jgi:hypothetical protein
MSIETSELIRLARVRNRIMKEAEDSIPLPDGFVAIDHDAGTLLRVAMAAIENGIKNNPTASDICCVSEGYALLEDLHEVITGGRFDHINRHK